MSRWSDTPTEVVRAYRARRYRETHEYPHWPAWDPYLAERYDDILQIPTTQLPAGVTLYHGTASDEDFEMPRAGSHFTTSRALAADYAAREARGARSRLLVFRARRRIPNLIDFPSIFDVGAYRDACAWLTWRFKVDFRGVGAYRRPEAFEAVRRSPYNGLLMRRNDGDAPDLFLSEPARWLELMRLEAI